MNLGKNKLGKMNQFCNLKLLKRNFKNMQETKLKYLRATKQSLPNDVQQGNCACKSFKGITRCK